MRMFHSAQGFYRCHVIIIFDWLGHLNNLFNAFGLNDKIITIFSFRKIIDITTVK